MSTDPPPLDPLSPPVGGTGAAPRAPSGSGAAARAPGAAARTPSDAGRTPSSGTRAPGDGALRASAQVDPGKGQGVTPADVVTELLALLGRHRATDASETRSVKRVVQLLRTTGSPFWRGQYHPGHLTASAVVVDPERRRTLLVFHEKLQRWLQPGGHFEPGEFQPVDAASREVKEETRLQTSWPGALPRLLDVDVHPIPARPSEPAHYHYDLRYLLVAPPAVEAAAGDGTTAVRWAGPDELDALGLDPGLRRALRKVEWAR